MNIADQIKLAMARAFFASAWADLQDEKDSDDPTRVNLSGKEITREMPQEIDAGATHAANTLAMDMQRANGMQTLEELFAHAQTLEGEKGDRPLTPEMFGHYAAMESMGHGVGLWDSFDMQTQSVFMREESKLGFNAECMKVPYVEFGSHSLQKDY
jgi:hypothetical protein